MEKGLIDAKLGGDIYKKRIALNDRGKRNSLRTILAFKINNKAFYIFGFAKNDIDNIDDKQLGQLKILARILLNYNDRELQHALNEKEIIEVIDHE